MDDRDEWWESGNSVQSVQHDDDDEAALIKEYLAVLY